MPSLIGTATKIDSEGNPPKTILEYIGGMNTQSKDLSIAHMKSPAGWSEPGQTPDFDEYSVILSGTLRVTSKAGDMDVRAGQAIHCRKGEWVQYSTPFAGGADYFGICVPAFNPKAVHRDSQ